MLWELLVSFFILYVLCVYAQTYYTFFHWPKLNHYDDDDDDGEEWRWEPNMNYNNNNYNVHNSDYPHNNHHCL